MQMARVVFPTAVRSFIGPGCNSQRVDANFLRTNQ